MKQLAALLWTIGFLGSASAAPSRSFDPAACQSPSKKHILDGCPPTTLVVGKNDTSAKFSTIQSAIASLGNSSQHGYILVLPGTYHEQLNVTRQAPLYIFGQTRDPEDHSKNLVNVTWASANGAGSGLTDNAFTSVLTVAPNLNASLTGAGPTGFNVSPNTPFGNRDFRVYNIDFRNIFSLQSAGPSLAISVSRANAGLYHSGFYSYQDTVYIGKLGNAYFYGGEVAGQTDFLYGFGTAWFEANTLLMRGCGGGIIAWKGTNTTFDNKYGCYVANSWLRGANESVVTNSRGRCALGRPWNPQHRSVYLNSYMDTTVNPQGYVKWSSNPATDNFRNFTFMAEYKSYGPGWNETARLAANVTKVLDQKGVRPYARPQAVFMDERGRQPYYEWIDKKFFPY